MFLGNETPALVVLTTPVDWPGHSVLAASLSAAFRLCRADRPTRSGIERAGPPFRAARDPLVLI